MNKTLSPLEHKHLVPLMAEENIKGKSGNTKSIEWCQSARYEFSFYIFRDYFGIFLTLNAGILRKMGLTFVLDQGGDSC